MKNTSTPTRRLQTGFTLSLLVGLLGSGGHADASS